MMLFLTFLVYLVCLLKIVDDGIRHFSGRILTAQILGANLAGLQHSHNGGGDQIAVALQIDVTQQLGAAQQHCRGISEILADGFGEGVSRTLVKYIVIKSSCLVNIY